MFTGLDTGCLAFDFCFCASALRSTAFRLTYLSTSESCTRLLNFSRPPTPPPASSFGPTPLTYPTPLIPAPPPITRHVRPRQPPPVPPHFRPSLPSLPANFNDNLGPPKSTCPARVLVKCAGERGREGIGKMGQEKFNKCLPEIDHKKSLHRWEAFSGQAKRSPVLVNRCRLVDLSLCP